VAEDSKTKTDKKKDDDAPVEVAPAPRSYAVPGNDLTGYIGVAPEYMNYADPSHKPYLTEREAMLFTNLTDEDIEATRDDVRNAEDLGIQENERPTVAEDTGFEDGELPLGFSTVNVVTVDPVSGPQHPSILSDEEEKRQQDIADGKDPNAESTEVGGPVVKGGESVQTPAPVKAAPAKATPAKATGSTK